MKMISRRSFMAVAGAATAAVALTPAVVPRAAPLLPLLPPLPQLLLLLLPVMQQLLPTIPR